MINNLNPSQNLPQTEEAIAYEGLDLISSMAFGYEVSPPFCDIQHYREFQADKTKWQKQNRVKFWRRTLAIAMHSMTRGTMDELRCMWCFTKNTTPEHLGVNACSRCEKLLDNEMYFDHFDEPWSRRYTGTRESIDRCNEIER